MNFPTFMGFNNKVHVSKCVIIYFKFYWNGLPVRNYSLDKICFFFQTCPEWSEMVPETFGMQQNMPNCFRMTDSELLRSSLSWQLKRRFRTSEDGQNLTVCLAGECFAPSQAVYGTIWTAWATSCDGKWCEALSFRGPIVEKRGSNRKR